jgi:hypothetical protein
MWMRILVLFGFAAISLSSIAAPRVEENLSVYRRELNQFRSEFGGGGHELPAERFFLFGMGLRPKFLYKNGALLDARNGEVVRKWDLRDDVILPADYTVVVHTRDGVEVRLFENEQGLFIESNTETHKRERIPGTESPVRLPDFERFKYPAVLRVLHQELLVNVTTNGPVPNFFVYPKPWYRDGAMMALAFQQTGNLDVIRNWILNLREPYDRNNKNETEADNLGQALFLVSLVSATNHPLVAKVRSSLNCRSLNSSARERNSSRAGLISRSTRCIRQNG